MVFFFIALIVSFGMTIIVVEKGDEWPAKLVVSPIRKILSFISPEFSELLDCPICSSFWMALIVDIFIFMILNQGYFLWPLTGFAASGITWFIYEFFGALDRKAGSETSE